MRYILLIYGDEAARIAMPDDDRHAMYAEYEKFANELTERGIGRGGDELASVTSATTVQERDGKMLVTDGPFAETKEQLGGYYLIEVENLDDAIEAAGRCPGAQHGTVEVRPVLPM